MGITAGIGALVSGGASLFGASQQADAAKQASAAQTQLGYAGLAQQAAQYAQTRADFQPYRDAGAGAVNQLTQQLPQLSSQLAPTESQLSSTPGYQFDLSQGLKSTQSAAAARGLGVSGAALKGASTYATGLADNTLQTQFNIDQTNKTNAYNKLYGTSALGETAAAQGGTLGQANTTAQTNLLTGIGAAQAGGLTAGGQAAANAGTGIGNAVNGGMSNLSQYYLLQNLTGNRGGSSMFDNADNQQYLNNAID